MKIKGISRPKESLKVSETWVYNNKTESKRQFMEWKHTDFSVKKSFGVSKEGHTDNLRGHGRTHSN